MLLANVAIDLTPSHTEVSHTSFDTLWPSGCHTKIGHIRFCVVCKISSADAPKCINVHRYTFNLDQFRSLIQMHIEVNQV